MRLSNIANRCCWQQAKVCAAQPDSSACSTLYCLMCRLAIEVAHGGAATGLLQCTVGCSQLTTSCAVWLAPALSYLSVANLPCLLAKWWVWLELVSWRPLYHCCQGKVRPSRSRSFIRACTSNTIHQRASVASQLPWQARDCSSDCLCNCYTALGHCALPQLSKRMLHRQDAISVRTTQDAIQQLRTFLFSASQHCCSCGTTAACACEAPSA